jgi:hypothetical protein
MIVDRLPPGVGEGFIGLLNFDEASGGFFGLVRGADIGMVSEGELPVGLLDVGEAHMGRDLEEVVESC